MKTWGHEKNPYQCSNHENSWYNYGANGPIVDILRSQEVQKPTGRLIQRQNSGFGLARDASRPWPAWRAVFWLDNTTVVMTCISWKSDEKIRKVYAKRRMTIQTCYLPHTAGKNTPGRCHFWSSFPDFSMAPNCRNSEEIPVFQMSSRPILQPEIRQKRS